MVETPRIVFIDSESHNIDKLIESLQKSFDNRFTHIVKTDELSNQLTTKQHNIIFIGFSSANFDKKIPLLTQLSQIPSNIMIAAVPENDKELTSKIIEFQPFFHISRPYDHAEVRLVLKRALEKCDHMRTRKNNNSLREEFCGIIGKSQQMRNIFDLISRVAEDDYSTVLIRGESGTGKELVAKAIHAQSRRKSKNFVPVNCAAIPDDLLESELFGHTKGAFTGANQNKQGRIQYADGGTLFLDEIGDMKPTLQAKLLRVLQEKEFEPVGGLKATKVDTRILAATHCDLEQLVSEGTFREDLYYRLSVIPVNIPPLKSRREDIPLLLNFFSNIYTTERGREKFTFSEEAFQTLLRYNWRGNVRELENLVQHMSILFSGKIINRNDLPEKYLSEENQLEPGFENPSESLPLRKESNGGSLTLPEMEELFSNDQELDFKEMINEFETKLIVNALRATDGNKKEAAKLLKLKRTTLLEKIKKKNLNSDNW
jgi:DNA-binding NtrC family response regulator